MDTSIGLDSILTSLGTEDNSTIINGIVDITEPVANETDGYVSVLSGFFVCTFTSDYVFELTSSGHSTMYLANFTSMEPITTCDHGPSTGSCSSDETHLEKGKMYYISIVY